MANMLMPGAELHLVGNEGTMEGGPARATHHTTSNPNDWSFRNEVGYFANGGAGEAPHLVVDPFTGQIAQFFPANSRSLSLQNDGAVRTNRTGKYNIQIEWVFTEGEVVNGKKYNSLAETPMKGLDEVMTWLRSLGIPDVWPGGKPTAWTRDTVSADMWANQGGHYGHSQVRGNSHVDPGPMPDIFRSGTKPAPKPTPVYAPFPGDKYFYYGRTSKLVTEVGKALVRAGYKGYKVGPGPVFGPADRKGVQWFQRNHKELAGDADGHFGPLTWKLLKVARP